MYQLSLRPIQLYEVVFPNEHLEDVLKMIQPYGGYGIKPKMVGWFRKIINKVLGMELEDIPKVAPDQGALDKEGKFIPPKNFLYGEGIDVLGIGIKRDKEIKFPPIEDL